MQVNNKHYLWLDRHGDHGQLCVILKDERRRVSDIYFTLDRGITAGELDFILLPSGEIRAGKTLVDELYWSLDDAIKEYDRKRDSIIGYVPGNEHGTRLCHEYYESGNEGTPSLTVSLTQREISR